MLGRGDHDDLHVVAPRLAPRLDALGNRRPRVGLPVERERRDAHLSEDGPRVEVHLLDPERAALLVEQDGRHEEDPVPVLVERRPQIGLQLVPALATDPVDPVVEPPAEIERSLDDGLVVPGEPELGGGRVHHLLGGRDPGRGDGHDERDAV